MGSYDPWDRPPRRRHRDPRRSLPERSLIEPVPVDPSEEPPPQGTGRSAEERTIEVPLAEWRRVLKQLDELVRLSKKLADARERAAKAETEVSLLRKQIIQLQAQRESGTDKSESL
jgi:hypothetical protein